MCGFFGVYNSLGSVTEVEDRIVEAGRVLAHRGPDDEGTYCDNFFGVHFQRLAIIDTGLSGRQPMVTEDRKLVMAFNGEIYNHCEIREILIKKGHVFHGHSDSAVLLASFSEWGVDCTKYLRGMFAFVVWNSESKILHVFRDRFGIKPLYTYQKDGFFVFSSEIKSILKFYPDAAAVNESAVFKYISRGWVDDSKETFYKDVISVLPGTSLHVENGNVTQSTYWSLSPSNSSEYNLDLFYDSFSQAVSLHLQADVPLAATLSGGMDSSSIVAVAAKEMKTPEALKTVSIIPPDTVDESSWIDSIVEHTGVSHSYADLDLDEMTNIFDEVLISHDEPFQSSNCIYQYILRKKVALSGIKVLLVGEGGDEILGGYKRLFFPYLFALKDDERNELFNLALDGAPEFLDMNRDTILEHLKSYNDMVVSGENGQENKSAYRLLAEDFIEQHKDIVDEPSYPPIESGDNRFLSHLMKHLFCRDIPYVLRMEDRNSMAHGVEARVPFLDHCFTEQVFTHDYAEFMRNGINKFMLRSAMKDALPKEVVERYSKSPRPGSNAHLVYDVLYNPISRMLKSDIFRNLSWWSDDCAEEFNNDCTERDIQRAEVWFRLYTVMRWVKLLKITT
jgi:asparagine synthase (glutamine-hydrolysing)